MLTYFLPVAMPPPTLFFRCVLNVTEIVLSLRTVLQHVLVSIEIVSCVLYMGSRKGQIAEVQRELWDRKSKNTLLRGLA